MNKLVGLSGLKVFTISTINYLFYNLIEFYKFDAVLYLIGYRFFGSYLNFFFNSGNISSVVLKFVFMNHFKYIKGVYETIKK